MRVARIVAGMLAGSALALLAMAGWDEIQWRLIERRARQRLGR